MGNVIEYADILRTFPNRGRPVMRSPEQNVHQRLFKDIWIVYEVHEEHVTILTVRHVRERPEEEE